jgi:hypothetical protein
LAHIAGSPSNRTGTLGRRGSRPRSTAQSFVMVPRDRSGRPAVLPAGALQWVQAKHAYRPDDLVSQTPLAVGEWICVVELSDDGWWRGVTLDDVVQSIPPRFFPATFVDGDSTWIPS